VYNRNTLSLASKFEEVAKKNTEFISREAQEPIEGIRELLDVQCRIAANFVGWWLAPATPFRKGHKELMPLLFSLFHRNFFTFYSALMLTLSGFYEAARPLLRSIFESLMISKFCHISEDDRVMKKWDSGDTIYFANSILKNITHPDTKPFYDYRSFICEHSHATKASIQVSLELEAQDGLRLVISNLALVSALLECNYHLLNTHLITPELAYMDKLYSTRATSRIRDYETPALRKRAHIQFKKNRAFLGLESIKLISAYKQKWIIKK
jgi:hypothetical protein